MKTFYTWLHMSLARWLFNRRRVCKFCNRRTWRYLKTDINADDRVAGECCMPF